ncbi:hypothetical protein Goklo_010464 [Gossypium klotzschianum]|uniref:Uncharacterized protein n=1 Tax=Gossypium klotzschianum TaxID=34286 RepID=A0A7J8V654_9ROSI|nr:hypothetical protein [Gossypium klotzschianum]
MTKAYIYFSKRLIDFGLMEEEYWHMKLETSRMTEMKNPCNY